MTDEKNTIAFEELESIHGGEADNGDGYRDLMCGILGAAVGYGFGVRAGLGAFNACRDVLPGGSYEYTGQETLWTGAP